MKWAFSLPQLLGNETIQVQEFCRKSEAKNRVSLFCRHYSIFGSFCILKKKEKKAYTCKRADDEISKKVFPRLSPPPGLQKESNTSLHCHGE